MARGFELDMIIDFNLFRTVLACRLNVKNVTLEPVWVVDDAEPVFSWIEEIFGVHNILKEGIYDDVSREINNLHVK